MTLVPKRSALDKAGSKAVPSPSPCVLDSVRPTDLPEVVRLYTCPDVRQYLGGPFGVEWAQQRAESLMTTPGVWAIRQNGPGNEPGAALLGILTLDRHHDHEDLEVSYLLLPEHWGLGHAFHAVRQALVHAFDTIGVDRVVAETQAVNAASIRLLERLGFRRVQTVTRFGAEQFVYLVTRSSCAELASELQ